MHHKRARSVGIDQIVLNLAHDIGRIHTRPDQAEGFLEDEGAGQLVRSRIEINSRPGLHGGDGLGQARVVPAAVGCEANGGRRFRGCRGSGWYLGGRGLRGGFWCVGHHHRNGRGNRVGREQRDRAGSGLAGQKRQIHTQSRQEVEKAQGDEGAHDHHHTAAHHHQADGGPGRLWSRRRRGRRWGVLGGRRNHSRRGRGRHDRRR